MPRCRACPVRWAAELGALEGKGAGPAHLQGVPACLHKYEPLFRRTEEEQPLPLPLAESA